MKVYVKYDKKEPHLPVAVADSKKELAEQLGISLHNVLSSFYHGRSTFAEVDIGPITDVIPCWADNDGGLWYWDDDMKTIYIRD